MKPYSCNSQVQEMPFVMHFAMALEMPCNTLQAKRILSVFFQTLRARIPLFSSNALITHLPNEVKPLIKDNSHYKFAPKFDYDEFINALFEIGHMENCHLFCSKSEVESSVSTVFEVIKERLTEKQYADLMSLMPLALRLNLLNDYVFDGHRFMGVIE